MAHWLVQGNPAKWRVHEFFADGNQLDNWSITRYRDQSKKVMTSRFGWRVTMEEWLRSARSLAWWKMSSASRRPLLGPA
jgi:hypothetical protein